MKRIHVERLRLTDEELELELALMVIPSPRGEGRRIVSVQYIDIGDGERYDWIVISEDPLVHLVEVRR